MTGNSRKDMGTDEEEAGKPYMAKAGGAYPGLPDGSPGGGRMRTEGKWGRSKGNGKGADEESDGADDRACL